MPRDFDYLKDALRDAVRERAQNPMSSRVTAVMDIARDHRRGVEVQLAALDAQEQAIRANAAKHSLPEFLVGQVLGRIPQEQKRFRAQLAELDEIIAEVEKAHG